MIYYDKKEGEVKLLLNTKMALTRSELREKTMIILYQIEILRKYSVDYDIEKVIKDNIEVENDFVKDLVYGVVTQLESLDHEANSFMKDWTIDRIDKTGASILRMALYELNNTDTPQIVVINEAIELAKKYSDDNVRKIINAVLDKKINS